MSDSHLDSFGAPPEGVGTRCCVCDGLLLFRDRPFKAEWRMWFMSSDRLMAQCSYDHAAGCEVSVVPAAKLIAMDKDQALAEARRMRSEGDSGSPPPSAR
ncbi:hypothetical protein GCM10011579_097970 [Streptomyces albiflavescens]|uniref:Uncharacterized protein n=2 Tax=Streptomyces albiflavescens TaxID=1623582 RepID=A0A917YHF0_9ACTN|nr:hypothetical protein GCM10011579_097970 [Streptomyces albiflavescens]